MTIAVVGKYTQLPDSYKSLAEAMTHGGIANNVGVDLDWIEAEVFETEAEALRQLDGVHGILVPGGFGERGSEGMIEAARFARERARALFRHLFRHADGGDRGGAASREPPRARAPPSSAVRSSGGRSDDRMDARQHAGAARSERRSRRDDAARRL